MRSGGWGIPAALAAVATAIAACDPMPEVMTTPGRPEPEERQTTLPWPLPLPSTSMEIPATLHAPASRGDHLTRPADWLAQALHDSGYQDLVWYDIPEGFAILTAPELTDDQGFGLTPPDAAMRFSASWPRDAFFTLRFWSELFARKQGRYRGLMFVVVDHPFGYAKDIVDNEPVIWKKPSRTLPASRADLEYKAQDKWYMLVYEFEHGAGKAAAKLVAQPVDPAVHFEKSGVKAALERLAGGPAPPSTGVSPQPPDGGSD